MELHVTGICPHKAFFFSCNKKARGRQSRLVQRLKETIKD